MIDNYAGFFDIVELLYRKSIPNDVLSQIFFASINL